MTMQKYVGVKMVEAQPMTRDECDTEMGRPCVNKPDEPGYMPDEPGYMVRYPDGYVSWSPKEVFERAYFGLADEEGNKILCEDVDRFMGPETVRTIDAKSTLVSVETLTGFVQHEASSCVDPANYDEEVGRSVGRERIANRVWPMLGFVLQWARCGLRPADGPTEPREPEPERMDFGMALGRLKDGRRVARAGWNGKGMWLLLQRPDAHSKMTLPYVYIEYPAGHPAYPAGSRVPWLASQTDLLSEDWVEVEPE